MPKPKDRKFSAKLDDVTYDLYLRKDNNTYVVTFVTAQPMCLGKLLLESKRNIQKWVTLYKLN